MCGSKRMLSDFTSFGENSPRMLETPPPPEARGHDYTFIAECTKKRPKPQTPKPYKQTPVSLMVPVESWRRGSAAIGLQLPCAKAARIRAFGVLGLSGNVRPSRV